MAAFSPRAIPTGPEVGDAFPEVNASRELNLGVPEEFPVDPISSRVASEKEARQLKEEIDAREAAAKAKAKAKKCEIGEKLVSALVISGVVVVAVGVAFFITKKLREA